MIRKIMPKKYSPRDGIRFRAPGSQGVTYHIQFEKGDVENLEVVRSAMPKALRYTVKQVVQFALDLAAKNVKEGKGTV